jgi:hypothetical protein
MYDDPNFIRLALNVIRWVTKEVNERKFDYDLFLSFCSQDISEAREIVGSAVELGLRVFMMGRKEIQPGAVWDEAIRRALVGSRELAVRCAAHRAAACARS